jgi:hypothetical protein
MSENPDLPRPDPALRRLDRLPVPVGRPGRHRDDRGVVRFTGSWREDGTFSDGWRPNPGADETVNVPYDIGGHRL